MENNLGQHFDNVAALMKDQKDLKKTPSNDDLKTIYGLFKQATIGDVNIDRPGMFDLTGKAKWDAWNSFKGKSQEEAKHLYVDYCKKFFKDEVAARFN